MMLRIVYSIILLLSVILMPFWVSVVLGLVGMAYFDLYLEALALFLLSDVLYGVPETRYFNILYVSFISASLALVLIEFVKKKLKYDTRY